MQYSGYFPVGPQKDRFIHYWFCESQGNPATDDVVLWMNGGPGYVRPASRPQRADVRALTRGVTTPPPPCRSHHAHLPQRELSHRLLH